MTENKKWTCRCGLCPCTSKTNWPLLNERRSGLCLGCLNHNHVEPLPPVPPFPPFSYEVAQNSFREVLTHLLNETKTSGTCPDCELAALLMIEAVRLATQTFKNCSQNCGECDPSQDVTNILKEGDLIQSLCRDKLDHDSLVNYESSHHHSLSWAMIPQEETIYDDMERPLGSKGS